MPVWTLPVRPTWPETWWELGGGGGSSSGSGGRGPPDRTQAFEPSKGLLGSVRDRGSGVSPKGALALCDGQQLPNLSVP